MAILTLLQGMGRLLRHRDDRGILAILDPRLQTMGYGRPLPGLAAPRADYPPAGRHLRFRRPAAGVRARRHRRRPREAPRRTPNAEADRPEAS